MSKFTDGPIDRIYVEWANTLDSTGQDSTAARERLNNHETMRVLHAAMGLATESAEIMDMLKKHVFYGKGLNVQNLIEEAGDVLWYVALIAKACGFHTLDEFMASNKAKLTARYGDTWNQDGALNRDIDNELSQLDAELLKSNAKCPKCGHSSHKADRCLNMESTSDCDCDYEKTQAMSMPKELTDVADVRKRAVEKFPTLSSIVAQLSACMYKNYAGPINNNYAFLALEQYAYREDLKNADIDPQVNSIG